MQHLVAVGELRFVVSKPAGDGSAPVVRAQVGDTAWALGRHLPALRAATNIYSFGLEHTRDTYYCLVLPAGTPHDLLDAVARVLAACCALSSAGAEHGAADGQRGEDAGTPASNSAVTAAAAAAAEGGAYFERPAAASLVPPGAAAGPLPAPPAAAGDPAADGAGPCPWQPTTTADRVAGALLIGGSVAAGAVGQASSWLGGALRRYAEQRALAREPAPEPARVPPHVAEGLRVAAAVAGSAASATGRLAALVGDASYRIAAKVAEGLSEDTSSASSASSASSSSGSGGGAAAAMRGPPAPVAAARRRRSELKKVGAAGLLAYVQVYDALEEAAKKVLCQGADATAQYIGHKYGPQAAAAASEGVPVARGLIHTATNVTRLGSRALISKAAQRSAAAYLRAAWRDTQEGWDPEGAGGAPRGGGSGGAALAAGPGRSDAGAGGAA